MPIANTMSFATWLRSTTRRFHGLRRRLLRFNFYRCHLGYFILAILITSCILYGSSGSGNDDFKVRYIDALFMAASAMTATGLNTIDLNDLTVYQQSVLFVLMLLGDLSTVSISVVVVRRCESQRRTSRWRLSPSLLSAASLMVVMLRFSRRHRPH